MLATYAANTYSASGAICIGHNSHFSFYPVCIFAVRVLRPGAWLQACLSADFFRGLGRRRRRGVHAAGWSSVQVGLQRNLHRRRLCRRHRSRRYLHRHWGTRRQRNRKVSRVDRRFLLVIFYGMPTCRKIVFYVSCVFMFESCVPVRSCVLCVIFTAFSAAYELLSMA